MNLSTQPSSPNDTIEVSLNTLEQHPILKITDHGKGIEASIIDKIFEPFFSTKKSTNGTGLGLSVVHGIIRAHGGSISVESEPNKQTTFTVSLPITK
jgi:signal transduction histidine kinase